MSERKVALIIDGMSELGTAICQRLRRDGLVVAASYPVHQRNPEAWLAAQRDEGGTFSAWCVDVGEYDDCAALMGKLLAAHGRLDVLVNLAGSPGDGQPPGAGLGQLAPAAWDAAMQLVHGAFNMNKQALPPMLEQRWGRIIQVASAPVAPVQGRRLAASHTAANAALHGLTRALALETARCGVTVNSVVPGYLRQSAQAGTGDDAQLAAQIPVGRLGDATEVAALVGYLASDGAAFVTGAQIPINGGQHMA